MAANTKAATKTETSETEYPVAINAPVGTIAKYASARNKKKAIELVTATGHVHQITDAEGNVDDSKLFDLLCGLLNSGAISRSALLTA